MTASWTHHSRRPQRRHSRATVTWMGSPLAVLLALIFAAPPAHATGSGAEDLPQAAAVRPPQPPILPVRATDRHGGSPPPSNRLQITDLRDPFAPSRLARAIPPGPYPVRVADLKDPFAIKGRRGGKLGRLLLPGDLRDPFRPRPQQDDTQTGTLPCWPSRSSTGVIIQRPRTLRERTSGQECEPSDEHDTSVPDLRDPFPVRPRVSPDHQSPLPARVSTPVAQT
jgi:hypothetical protein